MKGAIIIEFQIALIAAGSALAGSLIPQVFSYLTRNDDLKKELRKQYKYNKTQAYSSLFEIIARIKLVQNKPVAERTEALLSIKDDLSTYKIKNGIWLSTDDLNLIDDLSSIVLQSARDVYNLKGTGYSIEFIQIANEIQNNCRNKIKDEYYI